MARILTRWSRGGEVLSRYFWCALLCLCYAIAGAQETERPESVAADGYGPLQSAINTLMQRHPGLVVSYEDAHYRHESDLVDVTDQVRPGTEPRILVAREGSVYAEYQVRTESGDLIDPETALTRLINAYNSGNNPGRFDLSRTGDIFHVVPEQSLNTEGRWIPEIPILDLRISLLTEDAPAVSVVSQLCGEISRVSGRDVQWGGVPINLFASKRIDLLAQNEMARSVLVRLLNMFEPPLTWQLNYSPMTDSYMLNIVPAQGPSLNTSGLLDPPQQPRPAPRGGGGFSPRPSPQDVGID